MYNLIETETKTLMLANARVEYAFTVVDPAVAPEIRTSPKRKLIVLSGGVLGGLFGVFAVFVINIFRQVTSGKLPDVT
jgi:LPS O-antigen subunit length determinant protein (WzzB/FepE family)